MVAIKDVEMPSCCGECNLTTCKGKDEPWNYCCSITLKDINLDDTERPSGCPLVEIEERKKGKWVKGCVNITGDGLAQAYDCSECGGYQYKTFNYCPNCGADMRLNNYDN